MDSWEYQLRKYSRIYEVIKRYYPKDFNKEKLFFASIEGFLKRLDPHSYFLDPLAVRSMNEDQEGNYFGIGTRITKYEDRLTVVMPLKGTPAYKMGIMPGDVVVTINGQDTKELSLDGAMELLRGAKDTYVSIEVRRESIESLIPFKIKRAEIPLESISYAMVHPAAPRIGYISIRTFGNTTTKEFAEKMELLTKNDNINALILDLRGNAGGSLYAAVNISDFFLSKGKVIVSLKGRAMKQNFYAREDNQYESIPVAVLINRGSASASEIVAAAIQDHKKGIIIGTRSWGKGLVQTVHKVALNTSLALTSARYYTPTNKCLQRDYSKTDDYLSVLFYKGYDQDKSIIGGVIPDITIKGEVYPELLVKFISRGLFFKFSRELIDSDFEVKDDFKVDESIVAKFKAFLKENNIQYDMSEFSKEIKTIRYEIEKDLISNAFSAEKGVKVFLESDPVALKAVEQLRLLLDNKENSVEK
ncbi:MAG: S41 family peptidase [bacterium]|nr:S41 family peptidase [bacterium]